jgi:myo-inositol-1(or 4)-monophosphatase
VLLEHLGRLRKEEVSSKAAADFVTVADTESQKAILEVLRQRFPEHHVLSEEGVSETPKGYRWVVDPLDGTTNFIHGFPMFCVSVALELDGQAVVGVVYDPVRDELFSALRGQGAWLNGRPIRVSSLGAGQRALLATGFPFRMKELIGPYLEVFREVFLQVGDLRRAGSAALDLAYVAAGRLEGFFELGLKAWDVAAGGLLVKEAGGLCTDLSGGPRYTETGNIIAANGQDLHALLLRHLKRHFPEYS